MKLFVCLFLILILTSFGASLNPSIINGEEASENQFPHQVGLYVEINNYIAHFCGGSLINPTFVITAAHCLVWEEFTVTVDMVFVLLGSIYLEEGVRRDARNFIIHPEYVGILGLMLNTYYDIAFIEIDYVNYSDSIMNIALPDVSEYYPDYEASVVITSGWGYTNFTVPESSPTLLYTALLVISDEVCMKMAGAENWIVEDWMCTASPIESGGCSGDSGGPLVHKDSMVLIGIASVVWNNCTGFYVTAFTRISYHRQWIFEMIGL